MKRQSLTFAVAVLVAASLSSHALAQNDERYEAKSSDAARMERVIVAGILGGGIGLVAQAINENMDAEREASKDQGAASHPRPQMATYAPPRQAYSPSEQPYAASEQRKGDFLIYNQPGFAPPAHLRRIKLGGRD